MEKIFYIASTSIFLLAKYRNKHFFHQYDEVIFYTCMFRR